MMPPSSIVRLIPRSRVICAGKRRHRPAAASVSSAVHHRLLPCNQPCVISRSFRNSTAGDAFRRNDENKNEKTTKRENSPEKITRINASTGRIAWTGEVGKRKKSAAPRLCSGCGVEIISTGGRNNNTGSQEKMASGEEITNSMYTKHRSKRQEKMARYANIETFSDNSLLCQRCESLQGGNIWKAYDALKDVDAAVFSSQLSHIVSRRQFGLCIVVVDATDPEFTSVRKLRDVGGIRGTPCILVINKVDLLPRDVNNGDLNYMRSRVESGGPKMIDAYGVSAHTGRGMVDLAEGLLKSLGGRDVFVVGAANVGKSTLVKSLSSLLARTLRMKGKSKNSDNRRRDTLQKLNVTASHLPGTTLQALRIPCFPSLQHALWDTPGIINRSALAYSLFPSHLMEPLAFPKPIHIPTEEAGTRVRVRAGHSILIEAEWVNDELPNSKKQSPNAQQLTLARLDIVESHGKIPVEALAFIPSCLKTRVVPTELAPEIASIPEEYIAKVQVLVGQAGNFNTDDTMSQPLTIFKGNGSGVMKDGTVCLNQKNDGGRSISGWIRKDIVFASLGWIMLNHRGSFTIRPWCVKGSLWSKRRPLYPSNLEDVQDAHDDEFAGNFAKMDDNNPKFRDIKERLQQAEDGGRHKANAEGKRKRVQADAYDVLEDDEAWWSA